MIKCNYQKKLLIIFIVFFTFGIQSCVTSKSISKQIKSKNLEVTKIQIAEGVGGRRLKYNSLGIYLDNGGRIFLDNLKYRGELRRKYQKEQITSRVMLIGIGEFQVYSDSINISTSSLGWAPQIPVLVIAQGLNINIQSIDDIIKNYNLIYEYVKLFPMFRTYEEGYGYGYGKDVPFNKDGEEKIYYLYKSTWNNEKYAKYVVDTFNFAAN